MVLEKLGVELWAEFRLSFIQLLAEIPGVARDSVSNDGTREINYGII
jgi:hypothetical protein